MREFVYTDAKSNKFWNIELEGNSYTAHFGKVDTKGQTRTKEFANEDEARKAYEKVIAEKVGKGYVETTTTETAPRSALLDNLEQALFDNPDDLASHSALADYLMEQNDPRGELIQVQLALEDEATTASERRILEKRESELLGQYASRWLGDIGPFLVGDWSGDDKPWNYKFRRGWLDSLRLLPFLELIFDKLARSPEARLLRNLEIVYDTEYHWEDFGQFMIGPNRAVPEKNRGQYWREDDYGLEEMEILAPLLGSEYLSKVRLFRLGFSDHGDLAHSTMIGTFRDCTVGQILDLLKKWPRLEELYLNTGVVDVDQLFASDLLTNLRVLQYYFGDAYSLPSDEEREAYPLDVLAGNESLKNLRELRLHPGREATIGLEPLQALLNSRNLPSLTHLQIHMTDYENDGARAIVDSGILKRLKVLDVGYGNMNDEGAQILAECEDLTNLEELNVSVNALTHPGIVALESTGVKIIYDNQHDGDEEADYLWQVDME